MREALGLRSDGTRVSPAPGPRNDRVIDHGTGNPRRHRFVQEGEVPVEVMALRDHGPRAPAGFGAGRTRPDDGAVAAERLAREQAERALAETTDRLREARTKLGHAELARDEALALAADRLGQIQALRQQGAEAAAAAAADIAALRQDLAAAQAAAKVAAQAKPAPKPKTGLKVRLAGAARPAGRQKAQKPVKWWIKPQPAVT